MRCAWLGRVLILSTIMYTYLFSMCLFVPYGAVAPVKYITALCGLISAVASMRYSEQKQLWFSVRRVFWLYRILYAAQMNWLFATLYPHPYVGKIYLTILIYALCNTLKSQVIEQLKDNFISKKRLCWYKDVIRLERFFTKCKTGACKMDDMAIVESIGHARRRLNPRMYFCLLCDDPETAALAARYEVLDIIRDNLRESEHYYDEAEASAPRHEDYELGHRAQHAPNAGENGDAGTNPPRCDGASEFRNYSVNCSMDSDGQEDLPADEVPPAGVPVGDAPADAGEEETEKSRIDLLYVNKEDLRWLNEKNDFIKVIKDEARGCLMVDLEAYKRLRRMEKQQLHGQISEKSLLAHLPQSDAAACFKILTQNFETSLSFIDFEENIRQMNLERGCLISTLLNNRRTMRTLSRMLLVVELFVLTSVIFFIFDVRKVVKTVVPPVCIFLFPVIWNIFDAFMFVICSHPYDIGDRIYIDDDNLVVRDIGLTSTTFERWNNEYVVVANSYIKTKAIRNIRRSKNQQWQISFYISADTSEQTRETLEANMRAFVEKSPAFEHITIVYDEIKECRFYKISFIVKHAINHQNGFFKWRVQNKFMIKLINECNARGMGYSQPEIVLA